MPPQTNPKQPEDSGDHKGHGRRLSQNALLCTSALSIVIAGVPTVLALVNGHTPSEFMNLLQSFCVTLSSAQSAAEIANTLNQLSNGALLDKLGPEIMNAMGHNISTALQFLHQNHLGVSSIGTGAAISSTFLDIFFDTKIQRLQNDNGIADDERVKLITAVQSDKKWAGTFLNILSATAIGAGTIPFVGDVLAAAQYLAGHPLAAGHTQAWFGHNPLDNFTPPANSVAARAAVLLQHSHHIIAAASGLSSSAVFGRLSSAASAVFGRLSSAANKPKQQRQGDSGNLASEAIQGKTPAK